MEGLGLFQAGIPGNLESLGHMGLRIVSQTTSLQAGQWLAAS